MVGGVYVACREKRAADVCLSAFFAGEKMLIYIMYIFFAAEKSEELLNAFLIRDLCFIRGQTFALFDLGRCRHVGAYEQEGSEDIRNLRGFCYKFYAFAVKRGGVGEHGAKLRAGAAIPFGRNGRN